MNLALDWLSWPTWAERFRFGQFRLRLKGWKGPIKKSCCFHLFLLDCNDFSSPSAFGGVCERGGTYNDFFGQEVVDWRRYFLNCGRENFETTHGEIFSFLRERERGGQNFPRKTCTLFFIRFALFGALLFFIAIWDFHFTAWHFKAFPLSSPVRFDVGSEFFFFFWFSGSCVGVSPHLPPHSTEITKQSPLGGKLSVEIDGKYQR